MGRICCPVNKINEQFNEFNGIWVYKIKPISSRYRSWHVDSSGSGSGSILNNWRLGEPALPLTRWTDQLVKWIKIEGIKSNLFCSQWVHQDQDQDQDRDRLRNCGNPQHPKYPLQSVPYQHLLHSRWIKVNNRFKIRLINWIRLISDLFHPHPEDSGWNSIWLEAILAMAISICRKDCTRHPIHIRQILPEWGLWDPLLPYSSLRRRKDPELATAWLCMG